MMNLDIKDEFDNKEVCCESTMDLLKYLKTNIEKVLGSIKDDSFIKIYKNCYKEFSKKDVIDRPSLSGSSAEAKKYRSQFNDIVMKTVFETVKETVLNMDSKLSKLEQLKKEQANSTVVWRPPGNASEHITPFMYSCLNEEKKEMENKINEEKEALILIKTRLLQKRRRTNELHSELLFSINEIRDAVTIKSCEMFEDK